MPKVQIKEVDNTGAIQLDGTSNVVYIPGLASGSTAVEPKLFSSVSKFVEKAEDYAEDGSYKLAKRLLQLGMQVLYEGVVASSATYKDASRVTSILTGVPESGESGSEYEYFKVIGSDIEFIVGDDVVIYQPTAESEAVTVAINNGVANFSGIDTVIKSATFDYVNKKVTQDEFRGLGIMRKIHPLEYAYIVKADEMLEEYRKE